MYFLPNLQKNLFNSQSSTYPYKLHKRHKLLHVFLNFWLIFKSVHDLSVIGEGPIVAVI
jgi:hypothetical protein